MLHATQKYKNMGDNTRKCMKDDIIEDVHKLCRLCLRKTEDSVPIYSDDTHYMCADLALRILICVGIKVSWDDCLPNMVCTECHKELERCYLFRTKCEVTNQKLLSHAKAVKEIKTLLKEQNNTVDPTEVKCNENTSKSIKEDIDSLLSDSKDEIENVEADVNNIVNEFNNGHLDSKMEIQENKANVEENLQPIEEPNFEAFLTTVLLQLGLVETKDQRLILQNTNVKTLEIDTPNGKLLVELTEEDQDPKEDSLSNGIETLEASISIKPTSEPDNNAKSVLGSRVEGGGREWARCDVCGKQFATRSVLRRHLRVHSGERPHACRICHRAFAQRSVMLRHELVHKEQRPHQCAQCPKSFTQRSALAAHMRAHAAPQQRALSLHPCPHCAKIFLYGSGLSRHMRVHSGRVFSCGECARPFRDKSSLLRHVRSVRHPPRADTPIARAASPAADDARDNLRPQATNNPP